jgi:hypothetical protein
MAYSDTTKNTMLDAITGTYISLHTADPGATGASEQSLTGSPAYARKIAVFDAAVAGVRQMNADVSINLPAATITHFGVWSAATGGTFHCGGDIADVTFTGQAIYKVLASLTSLEAV